MSWLKPAENRQNHNYSGNHLTLILNLKSSRKDEELVSMNDKKEVYWKDKIDKNFYNQCH